MPQPARARTALLAAVGVLPLSVVVLAAPAAHADQPRPPRGLTSLPTPSSAVLHAVPVTTSHGRKLR